MKETVCDMCSKPATYKGQNLDVCVGWLDERVEHYLAKFKPSKTIKFKPFEKPDIFKRDFCEEHLQMWCKATYEVYLKMIGPKKEVV